MRLYISGPMTGYPDHNYPAFAEVAETLRAQGYTVISPHELASGDLTRTWAEYLREDLKAMLDCHGIVVLEGWQNSRGAQLEHHVAEALGMEIRDYVGGPA
jgi:Domain of unknown function (DUF4406)